MTRAPFQAILVDSDQHTGGNMSIPWSSAWACVFLAGSGALGLGCLDDSSSQTPDASPGLDGSPGPTAHGSPGAASPDGGGRTDGIVRELLYRQITSAATKAELPTGAPAISANGKRIAFAVAPGTQSDASPNRIFVVNVDGSELKQVDAYKTACFCGSEVAISDDGNTIVSTDSMQVRVVDASGALKGAIVLDNNVVWNVTLNGDGSEVFFVNARDSNQITPTATPRQRGTYAMKRDATGLTQILSPQTVAPLVGKTSPDDIFPFAGCGTALSVSGDGAKVFTVVNVAGAGQAIIASGSGAGASVALGPVTDGNKLVYAVAVSHDGKRVGYWAASAVPAGGEVGVMGADGSGKKKLFEAGAEAGCKTPFTITSDGSKVALSFNAMVFPTDGAEPWAILASTGFFSNDPAFVGAPDGANSLSMSGDGKTFAYLNGDGVVGGQIAVAHLDPTDTGSAPRVTEPTIAPAEIPHDLSVGATLQARVGGTPIRVGGQVFNGGFVDSNAVHADKVLVADGGVYQAEGVTASTNATPGPRLLRVKAEGKDGSGSRQAHAVDFGPFSVK
jgi:hypothetical protein